MSKHTDETEMKFIEGCTMDQMHDSVQTALNEGHVESIDSTDIAN